MVPYFSYNSGALVNIAGMWITMLNIYYNIGCGRYIVLTPWIHLKDHSQRAQNGEGIWSWNIADAISPIFIGGMEPPQADQQNNNNH